MPLCSSADVNFTEVCVLHVHRFGLGRCHWGGFGSFPLWGRGRDYGGGGVLPFQIPTLLRCAVHKGKHIFDNVLSPGHSLNPQVPFARGVGLGRDIDPAVRLKINAVQQVAAAQHELHDIGLAQAQVLALHAEACATMHCRHVGDDVGHHGNVIHLIQTRVHAAKLARLGSVGGLLLFLLLNAPVPSYVKDVVEGLGQFLVEVGQRAAPPLLLLVARAARVFAFALEPSARQCWGDGKAVAQTSEACQLGWTPCGGCAAPDLWVDHLGQWPLFRHIGLEVDRVQKLQSRWSAELLIR